MNRLRWLTIQLTERLGMPGTAALLILCATAVYYLHVVMPLEQRLMAETMVTVAASGAPQAADPKTQIEDFRMFFRERDLEGQLKALHAAGATAGITLKRIEYRMLEEPRARLRQYQIVMPVTSSYPNIRKFVSVALTKVPAMSLDHVSFQRKRVGDAAVEAELQFTLYLADPA